MPSAESIQPDDRSLNLFVSRFGAGKSTAAYSYPHPIKVLDTDMNIRGGISSPWINRKGIDYVPILVKDPKMVFQQLNDEFEALSVLCKMNQCPYQTLVLDSATWTANGLLLDALPLTHTRNNTGGESGRKLGPIDMAGPSDYGFQSTGILQIVAYLRSLPIRHIIVTAHLVNRYGRRKNSEGKVIDPYGPTEIVGEQLALTDKIAETLPTSFGNIFRFEKRDTGNGLKFTFEAQGEMARTTYPLPYGEIDITGRSFYDLLMERVNKSATDVVRS